MYIRIYIYTYTNMAIYTYIYTYIYTVCTYIRRYSLVNCYIYTLGNRSVVHLFLFIRYKSCNSKFYFFV